MHIYQNKKWQSDFLDEFLDSDELRLQVYKSWAFHSLHNIYFEPNFNIKRVISYVIRFGIISVVRKIFSRWTEKGRNEKYMSIGLGLDLQANPPKTYFYLKTIGPMAQQRVVVNKKLALPVTLELRSNVVEVCTQDDRFLTELFNHSKAWTNWSGVEFTDDINEKLHLALQYFNNNFVKHRIESVLLPNTAMIEFATIANNGGNACLVGYGNHAKTMLIPNLNKKLKLNRIHEIDITQIGQTTNSKYSFDTSPYLRKEESWPYYFIAGFHHTHAVLAIQALRKNAFVCIEKPPVTDRSQAEQLIAVLKNYPDKLCIAYNYRYHPFNELIKKDFAVQKDEPINYFCLVYETVLPKYHWYNWPNSGSRIISNACHWIDHFMFLNNFNEVLSTEVKIFDYENFNIRILLKNNAKFSMVLTNEGSSFSGVEDHIELRAKDITVKIDKLQQYSSKNKNGIIRRVSSNKMKSFENMYQHISSAMVGLHKPIDNIENIQSSINVLIELEEKFQQEWSNFRN